jgi:hypothetical protein
MLSTRMRAFARGGGGRLDESARAARLEGGSERIAFDTTGAGGIAASTVTGGAAVVGFTGSTFVAATGGAGLEATTVRVGAGFDTSTGGAAVAFTVGLVLVGGCAHSRSD